MMAKWKGGWNDDDVVYYDIYDDDDVCDILVCVVSVRMLHTQLLMMMLFLKCLNWYVRGF